MFNVLDLFSGIGGFSLGLERTGGFRTVAFCEIEPFCREILKKNWPEVPIYEDVKTISEKQLSTDGITVDVICGGFPCQDISTAGRGAGLAGERSGLWFQFHRLIEEIQPRYAIIENVSALRSRGLDQVLKSLAEIRYDAEWHCIPASAIGAPHQRDRIWIVAYPQRGRSKTGGICGQTENGSALSEGAATFSAQSSPPSSSLADTNGAQCEGRWLSRRTYQKYADTISHGWWEVEPDVGRMANGVPNQSHRLRALGNAVVPQIPEMIGRAILETSSGF